MEHTGIFVRHIPSKGNVESRFGELTMQVNLFLNQLSQVMQEMPEKVGGFHLDEFEVSAGIVVEAKGEVKLALLANAEAGAGVNAGLRFVFKRASS